MFITHSLFQDILKKGLHVALQTPHTMKEDKNISIWKPSFIHQRFSHILKETQNDFRVDSMYSETEAVSSRHKTHKAKHKLMFEIITIKLKYQTF